MRIAGLDPIASLRARRSSVLGRSGAARIIRHGLLRRYPQRILRVRELAGFQPLSINT